MTALRQSYLCKSMGTCSWWGCQRSIKVLASIPRSCSHPIDYILASKGSTSLDFESTALLYRDLQDPSLERESWTSSIHYQLEKTIIPQNQKKKKKGGKISFPKTLYTFLVAAGLNQSRTDCLLSSSLSEFSDRTHTNHSTTTPSDHACLRLPRCDSG